MSKPDPFPTANQLSPRAAWYALHALQHRPVEPGSYHGNGVARYMVHNGAHTRKAFGADENEASINFAARYGLTHYSIQPPPTVHEIW